MLKTEQNTPEMQARVLDAAKVHGSTYKLPACVRELGEGAA
jgi:hypothetical protein